MTHRISQLIARTVTPENAAEIEDQCQAELCLAHVTGDQTDYLALRGKLHQAREARCGPVIYGQTDPLTPTP